MEKTYIIAEAGINHNGDLELARQMIDVAVDAGADAVKFQTFKKDIARKGGNAAKKARLEIEKQTEKPIVTTKNANNLLDKPNHKNIENE